jgi:hypothetical protein
LKRPSGTPGEIPSAALAPRDDQSGTKKAPVFCLMAIQSSALPGPSKVDANTLPLCL